MPKFLSPTQHNLLTTILDRLIPPQGNMPGTGETGTTNHLDETAASSPQLARLFSTGLQDIEIAAAQSGASFTELNEDQQDEVLRNVESANPDFFDALVRHTYNGYYTNPTVIGALGLDPTPPQPRGNHVERGNLTSLQVVIERGQAYRDA